MTRWSSQRGHASARILVTGGDYTGPLAATRALRAAGYEPWVVSTSAASYGARSRAAASHLVLPDSRSDPDGFVEGLRRVNEEVGFSAILGGTERDLLALARSRERFGPLAGTLPELEKLRHATSKTLVNALARAVGLHVPRTVSLVDANLAEERPPLPWILKPFRSEDERPEGGYRYSSVRRVDSYDELRSFIEDNCWFAQELVPGQLGAICGIAWQGEIVCAVHQRSQRIWPDELGISAYAVTVARDEELEEGLGRLLRLLKWNGIFQAQFIYNDECAYLIDLNPRIYGSLALAVKAGANLPAVWVGLLTGQRHEPTSYRAGVHYRYEELDAQALYHLLAQGKVWTALRGVLPRPSTTHAIARLSDPRPLLTSVAKLHRRSFEPPRSVLVSTPAPHHVQPSAEDEGSERPPSPALA